MAAPEIRRFADAESLARAAAVRWIDARSKAASDEPCSVALSGGRIAKNFLRELAARAAEAQLSFENVHFFWADERCVPPDNQESNFLLARQNLFDLAEIPGENIHRIRGEDEPPQAAEHAATELKRIAPDNQTGEPILDFVFLGMGEDGHVASLFPGESTRAIADPAPFRAVVASKPPPQRITMSYGLLTAAREAWVLASGAGKADALRESLKPGAETPLARVIQGRKQTLILTDIGQ